MSALMYLIVSQQLFFNLSFMIMTKVYVKNKKVITYLPFDKVFQYYKSLKSNFKTS